ncbi:ExbD/TolR family protein [Marinobacter sp. V034]|uniref:ExbD/TolR family protein n=1 Tax=Marinobacter sp. V034 TaxID=3459610 RepID=UPI0040439DC6
MRRRHRRLHTSPELDITAFMNLMIVLVPVLLLGMVFTQVRMIDLDFPGMASGQAPDPDAFQLEVLLVPAGLRVADSERGLIKQLPVSAGGDYDFSGLQAVLKGIKSRMPEKTDLTLRVAPDIDYQVLIKVMDAVRSYPDVIAASVVQAELFPDVALGDAPENAELSQAVDVLQGRAGGQNIALSGLAGTVEVAR